VCIVTCTQYYLLTLIINASDAADNIDLYFILCEYESYFEMKFGKIPKLIKKSKDIDPKSGLPKISEKS